MSNSINDEGPARKYFTMIPHLIDDSNMDPFSFRLYCHLKRICDQFGTCNHSTRQLSLATNMSLGSISRSKTWLANNNYIYLESIQGPHGPQDLITLRDLWPENMTKYASERSPHERKRSPHERFTHNERSPHERKRSPHEHLKDIEKTKDTDPLTGIWHEALEFISTRTFKFAYDQFFRDTKLISIDGYKATIQSPPNSRPWLQLKYQKVILEALAEYNISELSFTEAA